MMLALTGVTSGVGRRFAEMALAQGHKLRGLVRQPQRQDALALAKLGVELVPGDLNNPNALRRLFEGAETAVHMAAHVGDWGPREEFERVNVTGTRNALHAAAEAKLRRFVHLSSVAVYGRPRHGQIYEDAPIQKRGEAYDDTKAQAEELVFELGPKLKLEVSAVRPPVIYGPYDRNFIPRMLQLLRKRRLVFINGGHYPMNLVWVDHVVDVLLRCCSMATAAGEAFNVMDRVSARPPTVREIATLVANTCNLPQPTRSIPLPVALVAGKALESLYRFAGAKHAPPLTPFVARLTTLNVIYDASKAVKLLNWKPTLDPLDGVSRYAKAFASGRRASELAT